MAHCLYKVVIQFTIYCSCFFVTSFASPDSTGVPATLQHHLQELQQKDSLEQWLYARIDYVDAAPFERIDFLMATQQAAWRTYRTYDERVAWFNLLILQGYYQLQTGNIISSINAYEAALAFYEAYPLPDADNIAYVLKPLGNNYTRLGDYHTALFVLSKTLALAQQRKDNREIAATYSNMAICARWKGDLPLAMEYSKAGITAVDRRTPLYGLLLSTSADILTEQGRYDTASRVIAQSLTHLQRYKHDTDALYWYASALQMASRIAIGQGRYGPAKQCAQEALQLFDRYFPTARQREKARVNELLGNVCLKTGQPQQALQYYQQSLLWLLPSWQPASLQAVPPEALLYGESIFTDALTGKATCLRLLGKPEAALDHYIAVFMAGHKLQATFFYTESRLRELQLAKGRADAAMQLAYTLWQDTHQKKYEEQLLLIAELSKAQVLAHERAARFSRAGDFQPADSITRKARQLQDAIVYYQRELINSPANKNIPDLLQVAEYDLSLLNKKTRQQEEEAPEAKMLNLVQLHHFFERIPLQATVLEFFAGRDSSYIIEMDAKGISAIKLITGSGRLQDSLQHFMQQWFMHGPAAMMNAPKQFYQQCYGIYAALFKGYQWNTARRYLLIPDGQFSYLPFDALVTNEKYSLNYGEWPFLFKQVALSQAYSLHTWYQQQTGRYPVHSFTGFFVSKGKGLRQPVLSVMQEYQSLQGMIKGDYFLDSMATWQNFTTHTRGMGVVHVSTHAVSSAQDSFPFLQLYDQPFYLFDLRYRSFAPSLVVLGACKTADGAWLAGEGVNSLSRGFTAAGAGGVIAGIWNVNDESAIGIMQQFYQQLQQDKDPALALHDAKLKWMQEHGGNATLQLPYYWAGIVYSGHLLPVVLEQERSRWWYYTAGTLVAIALVILLMKAIRRRKQPRSPGA
ncbi:CHAT domain-containing protein [Paraflavitalea soli]|uniref:CHAT domain-containing protein n=1 Tax=Paraflavitalea soli TaxID=2315862 RepID=A0A3B7MK42_9BACT|nr:CHAT domain-containing protein [Paraflavitalea soli]AXY73480.1 CHAT domain-containing protein [Paraflavitalea soli]